MDKPKSTPKDFFLWAGAMISLWAGVVAFIALIFDYINYAFPDPLQYYWYSDPYRGSISYEMASLIVLTPVFLILMRAIRRDAQRDPSRNDIWVRRWALYLTLFAAGATVVVDLIVLLTTFLSGEELTMRFLLKVAVVLLVAAAGFMHFLADLRGYWRENPTYARYINYATGLLVALTVIAGFFIVGTPGQAREYRMDEQRVSDLQSIQSQVISYWQAKESLPASLEELDSAVSYFSVPVDPQTGAQYVYKRQSPLDFTLCATFATESPVRMPQPSYAEPYGKGMAEDWSHGAGEQCFDRSIDPDFYPPLR